jgi:outer membrane biosynthesis protein TonB
MSYESKLNHQSGKLLSPAQLCLLLSVAFHLLVLKYGLPTIEFNNDSGRREVSLIELNPEQQSRLPDLSPQLDALDIPEVDNLPSIDDSEPAAPFAIPPSLIPGIGDNANLPPLTIPPPPQFDLPPLPPQTDITLPPIGDLSALPLPPEIDPSDFQVEPIKLPPNTGNTSAKPSDSTSTPASQLPKPPVTTAKPQPQPQPEETKTEPEPKPTPEQIAAQKLAASQERINKLRQNLTKTEAGTTDEDARKNYIAWLAKVKDVEPDAIEIKGVYPRDACIRRLKGTSVYGVVVNAKGEVVALDLIKGAEYGVFDKQAGQDISDRTFDNSTEKPKPYQVTVNYEYDAEICPSLTLPSIRKEQPLQSEPNPTPKPMPETETEAEPEPEPEVQPKPEVKPKPVPEVQPKPETEAKPTLAPEPLPSLRDRLRDIPLQDLNPTKLKDIPLPERPNFER